MTIIQNITNLIALIGELDPADQTVMHTLINRALSLLLSQPPPTSMREQLPCLRTLESLQSLSRAHSITFPELNECIIKYLIGDNKAGSEFIQGGLEEQLVTVAMLMTVHSKFRHEFRMTEETIGVRIFRRMGHLDGLLKGEIKGTVEEQVAVLRGLVDIVAAGWATTVKGVLEQVKRRVEHLRSLSVEVENEEVCLAHCI